MTAASTVSGTAKRRAGLEITVSRFNLPPVRSVLVIGKKAVIGPKAMEKALHEMEPNTFARIDLENEHVESLIVRKSHLLRIPEETLSDLILRNVDGLMDSTETLCVDIDVKIFISEEIDL